MSCLTWGLRGRRAEGREESVAGSWPFCCMGLGQGGRVRAWGHGSTEGISSSPPHPCASPINSSHSHSTEGRNACLTSGGEAWVEVNRDNQCVLSCLSCSFMLSKIVCMCTVCACSCTCMRVVWSGEMSCCFQMVLCFSCYGQPSYMEKVFLYPCMQYLRNVRILLDVMWFVDSI